VHLFTTALQADNLLELAGGPGCLAHGAAGRRRIRQHAPGCRRPQWSLWAADITGLVLTEHLHETASRTSEPDKALTILLHSVRRRWWLWQTPTTAPAGIRATALMTCQTASSGQGQFVGAPDKARQRCCTAAAAAAAGCAAGDWSSCIWCMRRPSAHSRLLNSCRKPALMTVALEGRALVGYKTATSPI